MTSGSAFRNLEISSKDARNMFFQDPKIGPGEIWGTLYLLRRDINSCLTQKILWPGTMLILAGIDLLGKFYAGEDKQGGVSGRFKSFINEFFKPISSSDDVEIIFQLRNSLLHSFGLYSKFKDNLTSRTVEYHFFISEEIIPITKKEISKDKYMVTISIQDLRDRFEVAVERYHTDLEEKINLQDNFNNLFPNYGFIGPLTILIK